MTNQSFIQHSNRLINQLPINQFINNKHLFDPATK